MVSCKIFKHLSLQVDPVIKFVQLRSTPFKDSAILVPKLADPPFRCKSNSTPSKSGSGLPDPNRLICCTISRCLLEKMQLLRNQISLCQHVFYYNGTPTLIMMIIFNLQTFCFYTLGVKPFKPFGVEFLVFGIGFTIYELLSKILSNNKTVFCTKKSE